MRYLLNKIGSCNKTEKPFMGKRSKTEKAFCGRIRRRLFHSQTVCNRLPEQKF